MHKTAIAHSFRNRRIVIWQCLRNLDKSREPDIVVVWGEFIENVVLVST